MSTVSLRSEAKVRRRRAIGRLIISLREGMTQTDLGIKLGDYQPDGQPIPQTTVSRWERGTIDMTFEQALEIEMALSKTPGTIARAGGYVIDDDTQGTMEEAIRVDPNLDPDVREDVIKAYRSYVEVSRRLNRTEFVQGPTPRRRAAIR